MLEVASVPSLGSDVVGVKESVVSAVVVLVNGRDSSSACNALSFELHGLGISRLLLIGTSGQTSLHARNTRRPRSFRATSIHSSPIQFDTSVGTSGDAIRIALGFQVFDAHPKVMCRIERPRTC